MRRGKKWFKILLFCLLVMLCTPVTIWATEGEAAAPTPTPIPIKTNWIEGWAWGPEVSARTACLIDGNTGAVLYDKESTERMNPASTTKVMTALVVLENAELDEVFTFTETGVAEAFAGSSNLLTQVGETFTVEDALHALMLKSANDFASQIAEYVGGSVAGFTDMMNAKAAELGCVNSHFNNAHGLTDENHWTCAYDLCLIMKAASENPDFVRIASKLEYVIPPTHLTPKRTITTHNNLIMPGDYFYEGSICGKTGYTDAAMYTYVSVAEKNGMKMVECTMKTMSSADSFMDAKTLLDYGFNSFKNITLQEPSESYYGGMATVPNSAAAEDIVVEQGESFDTILGTMMNQTYYFNGHKVGDVAVAMDYIEQVEAEEEARILEEEEKIAAALAAEEAAKEAKRQAFNDKIKMVFKIIIIVLLVLIFIFTVLLIMALLRRRRRRMLRKKRRQQEILRRQRERERQRALEREE